MIQRVFAPSHIESVAIGQKRLSVQIFYCVRYGFSVIRPQIRQIPWFPKVNFNRDVLFFEVDAANASLPDKSGELFL